jgi:hypothetical protein
VKALSILLSWRLGGLCKGVSPESFSGRAVLRRRPDIWAGLSPSWRLGGLCKGLGKRPEKIQIAKFYDRDIIGA